MKPELTTLLLGVLIIAANAATGAEVYVAPNGKDTNAGTREAPWSLAKANAALKPGDTAILLEGTYTGQAIAPKASGEKGKFITYRSAVKHKAVFKDMDTRRDTNGPVVATVNQRSYIELDGIKSAGVKRWVYGRGSHHITLRNCHFEKGSGWINCRFENNGDGIRLLNNHFHGGTDLVSIDGGKGHFVEGNFFGDASHTGLVFLGVQRSVVRNNRFTNRRWRCMEVESQRHKPFQRSLHNVIERNVFDYTPCSSVQYAGTRGILRNNIFRRCLTGFNWANYRGSNKGSKKRSPEAWHNEHNRFYNNVITECGTNDVVLKLIEKAKAEGVSVAERVASSFAMTFATNLFDLTPDKPLHDDCAYGNNLVVNNIFYKNGNVMDRTDKKGKTSTRTTQVSFDWNASPVFGFFYSNAFFTGKPEAKIFYFCDAAYLKPPETRNRTIADFEKRYPKQAGGNKELDPKFKDADKADYHLLPDSPCVDAGRALSAAASAGKGKTVTVKDALYFTDGHGLIKPDVIRVGDERATIVSVDYEKNQITVDKDLTWTEGAPVTLDYKGKAPDLGAFETR